MRIITTNWEICERAQCMRRHKLGCNACIGTGLVHIHPSVCLRVGQMFVMFIPTLTTKFHQKPNDGGLLIDITNFL